MSHASGDHTAEPGPHHEQQVEELKRKHDAVSKALEERMGREKHQQFLSDKYQQYLAGNGIDAAVAVPPSAAAGPGAMPAQPEPSTAAASRRGSGGRSPEAGARSLSCDRDVDGPDSPTLSGAAGSDDGHGGAGGPDATAGASWLRLLVRDADASADAVPILQVVAAFVGDIDALLAMRGVSRGWLDAVLARAKIAHPTGVLLPPFGSRGLGCRADLRGFAPDAPQSQRMFFVAMAMLSDVAPMPMRSPRSAGDGEDRPGLVLELCCAEGGGAGDCPTCRPTEALWRARRHTSGARQVRGLLWDTAFAGERATLQFTTQLRMLVLDLAHVANPAEALSLVVAFTPKLEGLSLRGAVSLDFAWHLTAFAHLHSLSIRFGENVDAIPARALAAIIKLPSLRRLYLSALEPDVWNVAITLAAKSALESLAVVARLSETDQPVRVPYTAFPKLRHVTTSGGSRAVAQVAWSQLETSTMVDLSADLVELESAANLRRLELFLGHASVAPGAVARLAQLKRLEEIALEFAGASEFLCTSASLHNMTDVVISHSPLTPSALARALPRVEYLKLRGVDVPPSDRLTLFSGLTSLQSIVLDCVGGPGVHGTLWESLNDARGLQRLDVQHCHDLPGLRGVGGTRLHHLRDVTIVSCSRMLADRETWRFLAALTALVRLSVTLCDANLEAATALFAPGSPVAAGLKELELRTRLDSAQEYPPPLSHETVAAVLATTRGLRSLKLDSAAVIWSRLRVFEAPLHTLVVRGWLTSNDVDRVSSIRTLRYVEFDDAPQDEWHSIFEKLTRRCPHLRTIVLRQLANYAAGDVLPEEARMERVVVVDGTPVTWRRGSVASRFHRQCLADNTAIAIAD